MLVVTVAQRHVKVQYVSKDIVVSVVQKWTPVHVPVQTHWHVPMVIVSRRHVGAPQVEHQQVPLVQDVYGRPASDHGLHPVEVPQVQFADLMWHTSCADGQGHTKRIDILQVEYVYEIVHALQLNQRDVPMVHDVPKHSEVPQVEYVDNHVHGPVRTGTC